MHAKKIQWWLQEEGEEKNEGMNYGENTFNIIYILLQKNFQNKNLKTEK